MSWDSMIVPLSREQIRHAIRDPRWQEFRRSLIGKRLQDKYTELQAWLACNNHSPESIVQVANYVNALKRGGLLSRTLPTQPKLPFGG